MRVLDELPRHPMLAGADGLRLALAGAQDKLPVVVEGDCIGLPRGHQPSTPILKPAIAAVDDSVHNEAFCMALLQAMGMQLAVTQIRMVGERAVLLLRLLDAVVLAPLYDVLCTAVYPALTAKMAMKVGSNYKWETTISFQSCSSGTGSSSPKLPVSRRPRQNSAF